MARANRLLWVVIALALSTPARAQAPTRDEFEAIVKAATFANRAESCARMQAFIDAHPRDGRVPQALVWMAQLRRSDGQLEAARKLYERVLDGSWEGEWPIHAQKGLGDVALESYRYGEAIRRYQLVAQDPRPLWKYVGQNALDNARGERDRFWIAVGIASLLLMLLIRGAARARLRGLWPLPAELVFVLPLLAALAVSAAGQEPAEAHALVVVAIGATLLLWAHGAALRARPPQGVARPLWAALGVFQVAGLVFCALVSCGLWGKLMDTVAMGGE